MCDKYSQKEITVKGTQWLLGTAAILQTALWVLTSATKSLYLSPPPLPTSSSLFPPSLFLQYWTPRLLAETIIKITTHKSRAASRQKHLSSSLWTAPLKAWKYSAGSRSCKQTEAAKLQSLSCSIKSLKVFCRLTWLQADRSCQAPVFVLLH